MDENINKVTNNTQEAVEDTRDILGDNVYSDYGEGFFQGHGGFFDSAQESIKDDVNDIIDDVGNEIGEVLTDSNKLLSNEADEISDVVDEFIESEADINNAGAGKNELK